IAAREFQAIRAARALGDRARWERPPMPPEDIHALLLRLTTRDTVIHDRGAPTAGTLEAVYRRPYQIHGAIGPSCGVALYRDGKLTVWTHGQGVFPLRGAVAELVKLPP